jgi:hypothetical protein
VLPFRVGLDVWPALRHPPGLGRWVRELARALVRLDERPELVLFELGPGARVLPESAWDVIGRPGVRRVSARIPRRALDVAAALGFGLEQIGRAHV